MSLTLLAQQHATSRIFDDGGDRRAYGVHDESLEPDGSVGQTTGAGCSAVACSIVDFVAALLPAPSGSLASIPLAEIPSPTQGVWHLGFIPIRAYALCIVLGIVAATVVSEIRMRRRGVPPYLVLDIVVWVVPFGIVGARIYHVLTSSADYFGSHGHPLNAFKIWEGGIGIWGGVAGGALGAFFACRRLGIPLWFFADALAPGLPLAQGIGRWGNYFNNELFGGPTKLPWGLKIYEWDTIAGRAVT